jgi:16S rRNA (adenine(1408)-N(1))-methyltransferase
MWIVKGSNTLPLERDALVMAAAGYASCLLDVGTGDGRFVYRYAREHPETFGIGLDPVREALREISAKTAKKPARGGLSNALFVMGSVEDLPGPLTGLADLLTINYPWGSLLRALVVPELEILEGLIAVMKPLARVSILFNYSVFEDPEYVARLELPQLSLSRVETELVPTYEERGLAIEDVRLFADAEVPHRTSWGQHLVKGSKRKTLLIEGHRKG